MSEQENNYTTPPTTPREIEHICPAAPCKNKGSKGQLIDNDDIEFLRRFGIHVLGEINNPGSNGTP